MIRGAHLSTCRTYRYALWRIWDRSAPYAMFVCLNPSTADETQDDPTVLRCIGFAKSWGFGGIQMTKLFAFRATEPRVMMAAPDPVGVDNDEWLQELARDAGVIVGAWGNLGSFMNRSQHVLNLLPAISYLKMNNTGHPAPPLYLKADLRPIRMHASHNGP